MIKPGPNRRVDMVETDVEPDVAVIDPPPALDAMVIVSDPALVVRVIFDPAAKVKVSVCESATTLSWPAMAIVLKALATPPVAAIVTAPDEPVLIVTFAPAIK